mmetsp:Transcript_23163/g.30247  ORF Transcript_23163/g.30247 Transcript_23163/m.30247 type:complete len:275 (+) Transcript_23163:148-972(+)
MARIVLGSYEGFIHGWDIKDIDWTDPNIFLEKLSFAFQAHDGGVKSLSVAKSGPKQGRLLVTGGQDELIRIYDLEQKIELGELQQHSGTITALDFFGSSNLLSASEDKTIVIWRVHDWAALHVLGGHKGAITSLAVHPTGKLAMSSSVDRTIRCWDLVNGRNAYISRVEGVPNHLCWSGDGSRYAYSLQALRSKGGAENPVSTEGPLFQVILHAVGEAAPCGTASYHAGHIEATAFVQNDLVAVAHSEVGNRPSKVAQKDTVSDERSTRNTFFL